MTSPEPPVETFQVHGTHGRPIALPLPLGPALGYVWFVDLPDGVTRVEDGPGVAPPPGRELGGSSGVVMQVATRPGRHRIAARLARPRGPDNPVRVVAIDLDVD